MTARADIADHVTSLIFAGLALLATHLGISSSGLRLQLVNLLGERVYRAAYSVLSLLVIVWLVTAWRAAPYVELWPATPAVRHLPFLLMPLALLMLVCAISQPNPTVVGAPSNVPARGMLRVTRHPLMWAILFWALAHLLANGDLAAVLFFTTFGALAFLGTLALDRKHAQRDPADFERLAAVTSNLPLLAVLQGRQRLSVGEIGWSRAAVAVALYLALILLHPWLFGVPVLHGS